MSVQRTTGLDLHPFLVGSWLTHVHTRTLLTYFLACVSAKLYVCSLLVEANPRIFPELIENRPRAHRCSFAASCSAGEERNNATVGFWSSIYTNAVQDDVENRQAYADKPPAESAGGPPKVQVPCGSLTPVLLHAFPNGRVHFFSLDVGTFVCFFVIGLLFFVTVSVYTVRRVCIHLSFFPLRRLCSLHKQRTEGAEPGVVANIDFDQIFIDVLISENLNQYCRKTCPSRDQTRALMQSRGYLLFPDVVTRSDLFVHPRSDVAEQFLTRQTLYDSVEVEAALAKSTRHSGLLRNALESTAVVPKAPLSTQWAKFQHHVPIRRSASNLQSATEFCGTMPQFDNFWNLSSLVRSRLDEDKTIYNTFFKHLSQSDMKDFHYIELGAFDGAQESNTRFFDLCLGWKGLLIEPNPRIFPKLVDNRPHAHRMSYAASCSAAEETNDATVGFWASKFTNSAQDQSPNREAYANRAKLLTNVPCGSLNPVILDLFPGGRVHFFSLDTEGTEHKVLEHIDFSQVHIDVLISENKNKFCLEQCEARDKTRALMKANGYVLYANTIPHSDLYVHPRSEFAGMITSG